MRQHTSLTSIVAIDRNGAIGCRNELPWKLRTDMQFFRSRTVNNTVIMGRKTYDSIGGPLPRRSNVILSHNNVLFQNTASCQLALSIEESLFRASKFAKNETFIVGGAQTYSQFAPLVDKYLVTIVDHEVPNADAFLDKSILNEFEAWDSQSLSKTVAQDGVDDHNFTIYEFVAPDIEERRAECTKLIQDYSRPVKKRQSSQKKSAQESYSSKTAELPQGVFAF